MTLVVDLCDRPGSLSSYEFVRPIAAIVGEGARVVHYTELDPADVGSACAVVMCGTALRDDGYVENLGALGWLRETPTPVLGICAGMQVIGVLHGARLVPCKEIGMTPIEAVRPNELVEGALETYQLHKFGLDDLGEFEVLARSERCVQAIKHRTKELYGIMFHPEVRRHDVVRRFLGLCGV